MRSDVRSPLRARQGSSFFLCSLGVALTLSLLSGCSGGAGAPEAGAVTSGATKPAQQATPAAGGDTSVATPEPAVGTEGSAADGSAADEDAEATTGGDAEATTVSDAAESQPAPAEAATAPTKAAPAPTKAAPAPTKAAPAPTKPAPTKPAPPPETSEATSEQAAADAAESDPPPPSGEALYLRRCKGCHGADGAAQTTMGKTYGVDSLVGTTLSRAKIIKVLEDGVEGTKMRSFSKKLTAEEMKRVADHVKTL